MKLGPLHVVTQRTMSLMVRIMARLQGEYDRLNAEWEEEERTSASNHFLHPVEHARTSPSFVFSPDADCPRRREAVRRVVAAYALARRDAVSFAPGMWDHLEGQRGDFIDALNRADEPAVADHLSRMFQTDLAWGLGYTSSETLDNLRENPAVSKIQIRTCDMLLGLAEAMGSARITEPIQDAEQHARCLDIDFDALLASVEEALRFELNTPRVGGMYGMTVAGTPLSIDTVYHAYTVYRLRELGALPGHSVAEIGGGFGCLALMARRAGLTEFSIYDLPWVNALQGYYLIMALPAGAVRLHGEDAGDIAVLPGWLFHQQGDRSVDWTVNTNSLPEIGRETALEYLRDVRRITRHSFLSINTEAGVPILHYGRQNCVAEMAAEVGGFRRTLRQQFWMRKGYVEEAYQREE